MKNRSQILPPHLMQSNNPLPRETKGKVKTALLNVKTNTILLKLKTILQFKVSFRYLFLLNCYLGAPWPTLGRCRGSSLTNPILITALFSFLFELKVTRSLVARLGPKARSSTYWDLKRDPFDSQCNTLTHLATFPWI